MTTGQEIEDTIHRVALHDRSAFDSLYSATSAKLFGIVLRVLKDRAAAEEVLQEVYLRLWRAGWKRSQLAKPARSVGWRPSRANDQSIVCEKIGPAVRLRTRQKSQNWD
jgi:RNA polymerase sigma-70 factor (ECF subfamily)